MQKKIFALLKYKTTRFFLFVIFLYHGIFNTITGQFFFDKTQTLIQQGTLKGTIDSFSLFFGFEVRDFSLSSPENESIVEIKELRLHYNLPLLFLGKVQISEIAIIAPVINLKKKNGVFNIEKIFPPTEKVKSEEDEDKPDLAYIDTYIPISIYGKLILESLKITYLDEDEEKSLEISDFSLFLETETKRFQQIPLGIKILEIPELLTFKIQEGKPLKIKWKNKSIEFDHPINLDFFVHKTENSSNGWEGLFKLGVTSLEPKYNGSTVSPLNMTINLNFKSKEYDLLIEDFSIIFSEKVFLKLTGFTGDIRKKNSKMNFSISESEIDFNILEPYVVIFDPSLNKLKGSLALSPFILEGSPENFYLNWNITGKDISITKDRKEHRIPELNLTLSSKLSVLNNDELKFSIDSLKYISLNNIKLIYDSITLKGNLELKEENLIGSLNISINELKKFTGNISGNLETKIEILPSKIFNPDINIHININKFQILIGGENTRISSLFIELHASPQISKDFKFMSIALKESNLRMVQNGRPDGIEVFIPGLHFNNQLKTLNYEKLSLKTNLSSLSEILPVTLSEKVTNLSPIFGNTPNFMSDLEYKISGNKPMTTKLALKSRGNLNTDFIVFMELNLNSDGKNSINLKNIKISGYDEKFTAEISGNLIHNPAGYIPDLDLKVNLQSNDFITLIKNIEYYGTLNSQIHVNDKQISGNLKSQESIFRFKFGSCPGTGCKNLEVVNLNFNLPIEHNLKILQSETILEGNKSEFLKNFYTKSETNFTIERISGSHPTLEEKSFLFANGIKKDPGLSGRIQLIDNKFAISNLNIKVLNGIISSKSIILHLSDAKPESMEILGNLQVRDIDLTELLAEDSKKNIDDGKIRGDINFSGKNLKDPIGNMDVFFSVYRIGKDFGKSAINVVSPPNLIRDYIVNSYSVDKIEAELSKGLVYITILFKQGLLSNLLTKIDSNKISQERMPLNNFLNRAQDEISTYNK